MRLTKWKVENFKSIEKGEFSLSDLTVLIGKNNSGKSNVIDSLKDFLDEHGTRGGHSALNESWVTKRLPGKQKGKSIKFNLVFQLSGKEYDRILLDIEEAYANGPRQSGSRLASAVEPNEIRENNYLGRVKYIVKINSNGETSAEVRTYFKEQWYSVDEIKGSDLVSGVNFQEKLNSIMKESFDSWMFVDPFRVPKDQMRPSFTLELDPNADNLINILESLDRNRTDVFEKIASAYVEIMQGVTDLDVEYLSESPDNPTPLTVSVYEKEYDAKFNLEEISSGSKEILALLTHIFIAADEADILIIEEPELHLHPGAEQSVFEILTEIIEENDLQVIIATHSDVFVNQSEVHEIVRTEREGATTIRSVESGSLARELSDLGYSKSGLLQSDVVVFVEGRSDKLILNQWMESVSNEVYSERISFVELEGAGNISTHGRSLVKLLISFDIPYMFVVDSDENEPYDVIRDYVHKINRSGDESSKTWWYTTPEHFHAWDDSDIEYFFLESPEAIGNVVGEDGETIRELITVTEAEKNVDVLGHIWQECYHSNAIEYQKDTDGVKIAKHMNIELYDEIMEVIDEIKSLV
jgi:predicted ATP-dependent endonuclease of OLD family